MVYLGAQRAFTVVIGTLAIVNAESWKDYKPQDRIADSCPDYVDYSQEAHEPFSAGKLKLPYMRPKEQCRTFNSPAVEVSIDPKIVNVATHNWIPYVNQWYLFQKVISDIKARAKDPDLARLFENSFPSTLDTTVKYFEPSKNLAFIVTGVSLVSHQPRDT